MVHWRCFVFMSAAVAALPIGFSFAQSRYPMPSAAPKIGVDPTERAEGIEEKIETIFANIDMFENYRRQSTIEERLVSYLEEIGAKPTPGQVHLFYVQATVNAHGKITGLKDFQYLSHAKNTVDAIRESFTLEGAPGAHARMYSLKTGATLAGIYVSAHPEGSKYIITGGSLTPAFYQKIRNEGLALREAREKQRAEEKRIADKRENLATAHAAGHQKAVDQYVRDVSRGPLPPGPALSSAGDMTGAPTVYLPPTRGGSAPAAQVAPTITPPAAHPPVLFDSAPAPAPAPAEPVEIPTRQ